MHITWFWNHNKPFLYDEFESPYLNIVHEVFFVLFSSLQYACIGLTVNYFLNIYQQVLSHMLTIYRNTAVSPCQFQNVMWQLVFFFTCIESDGSKQIPK